MTRYLLEGRVIPERMDLNAGDVIIDLTAAEEYSNVLFAS